MIERLSEFDDNAVFDADLVIVGAGPVGLTLATQCARKGRRVLIVESGLETETAEHSSLNAVESCNEPRTEAQHSRRNQFHGQQVRHWSRELQPFGARCRALGGSTHGWAGKSAPFDAIDFRARPWVANSGWPVDLDQLGPCLARAQEVLNICPLEPAGRFHDEGLRSQYWQFARSRVDRMDVMRFGREFTAGKHPHVRSLLDATVINIDLNADATAVVGLSVSSFSGKRAQIRAGHVVLAAGGIENARLLLASNDVQANGIGNRHDLVGRYLMDHLGTRIASVQARSAALYTKRFGFFGVRHNGASHMFMHGLALTSEIQEREGLLNAAIYFLPKVAPDDPWDALKRLIRRDSDNPAQDLASLTRGAPLLAKGLGVKLLNSDLMPGFIKDFVVNAAIRLSPNMVAEEFANSGLPHKLTGMDMEAICENAPDHASRIRLSDRRDRFGVPLAMVDWRVGDIERRTLLRMAELSARSLAVGNLPAPVFEQWFEQHRPEDSIIIDMAHTLGTTRMASSECTGVVDSDCKVFGVQNLYVAGGSVFPTSGHANPTLMMLAFAIRLADHLNREMHHG